MEGADRLMLTVLGRRVALCTKGPHVPWLAFTHVKTRNTISVDSRRWVNYPKVEGSGRGMLANAEKHRGKTQPSQTHGRCHAVLRITVYTAGVTLITVSK
jgi:hypothetical protein